MAVTTYNRRCDYCGGNDWEYIQSKKIWICNFCGNQVERKETYDGLFTIKNVVRQVIMETAERRMYQASQYFSECQKMNARYPGTLVAGICFRVIAAANGGFGGQDQRSLLGQVRRDYQQLIEEGREMSDDETAVYEFMDSSDAWAALAMVFDILGDQERREYLLTLTEPEKVYSKHTNMSLLRFSLKKDRRELTLKVLDNQNNIDVPAAFRTVLKNFPDCPEKGPILAKLAAAGGLREEDKEMVEDYMNGSDSKQTKTALAMVACQKGVSPNMEILQREVMGTVPQDQLDKLLKDLFARRLHDGEVEMLLDFAAAQREPARCISVLDAMASSGQFISLGVRQAQSFICNTAMDADERRCIIDRLRRFAGADRLWETVTGHYLCKGNEPVERRDVILSALFSGISFIPARDFEQYVLTCLLDGAEKPRRIARIFELGDMKPGFFRELAGKYMRTGKDNAQIRQAVVQQLMESGMSLDAGLVMELVCAPGDSAESKLHLLQSATRNGTMLRADALSVYLEKCAGDFSSQLFGFLYQHGNGSVSAKALENYVLRCRERPEEKLKTVVVLGRRTGVSLGASQCTVHHLGNSICCSLAQAYILTTTDEPRYASQMVQTMTIAGTRLNTDIQVSGRDMKFGKYLNETKNQLSPVTRQLCQDFKLFGMSRLFG